MFRHPPSLLHSLTACNTPLPSSNLFRPCLCALFSVLCFSSHTSHTCSYTAATAAATLLQFAVQRAIRLEFLRMLGSIMANYRSFLFFANGQLPYFNTARFLEGRSADAAPFLARFLETQMFGHFLEKHTECPSYFDVSSPDFCRGI